MPTRPPVLILGDEVSGPRPVGWHRREGFALPGTPWDLSAERLLCSGVVDGDEAAEASLLALARGAGLEVDVRLEPDARRRYLEDVERVLDGGDAGTAPQLGPDARALLDALSAGHTVAAAAESIHVSLRSANRVLAAIRRDLGVATTAEVVAWWVDLNR